ncbi:uncharacterized protein STEHIDRAFT_145530 [Stereum hirsutum FP-91666 SS1]|uniref:uncharacterized protein n=1 Tax=Stereum hirsutum (strain FP-91666) TaxID=721885 RepID=UPI000440D9CA|nr:uncharacterized protein STEHIDRAFT_145530 [Stereum hirsutum FP-91666 SS1]EIM90455.1 hypothetical protein STEHIDRAFT_145530 [Stereum hirsutum FP-91666 SS1]
MLAFAVLSLLLPAYVSAQIYGPAPGGGGTTTSASAAAAPAPSAPASTAGQINVDVSPNAQFMFNPNNITAPNGTLVTFFFPSGSLAHSVTQSSFDQPCTWLAAANGSSGGFDSGLQTSVQFTINITNDQEPIWFHCKQIDHCGLGMVGAINAPTSGSNTFQAFMSAAMAIGSNEVTETDNGPVTGGVNAIATAAPAATASSSSSSSSGSSSDATRLGVSIAFALVAAGAAVAFL